MTGGRKKTQPNDVEPAEEGGRNGDRNESQTVLRACEVLKAFRHVGEELQLTDVMDRTRLPKTTTFRLLRTLIHGGLIERANAGVYRNSFVPVTAQPFRIASHAYWIVTRIVNVHTIREIIPNRFSRLGRTSKKMTVSV